MSKSLDVVIYERIKSLIIIGALPVGSKISESMIIERLDSTKSPVRNAFKKLKSEGLIRVIPKSGTYIFDFEQGEFEEFLHYRHILEVNSLRILSADKYQLLANNLSIIYDQMIYSVNSNRLYEYVRLNDEFHQEIVVASGNKFIIESYDTIATKMSAIRNQLADSIEHIKIGLSQHKEIISFLMLDDIKNAIAVLELHILPSRGSFWKNSIGEI
ncbi:GntR family transcriptional regulator [Vibrio sp. DNB22_10_4]